ncbi:MAG: hypothetical protein ACREFP_26610 [Acetobacteraceae bacterium]
MRKDARVNRPRRRTEDETVPTPSAAQITTLHQIPAGQIKTIQGAARNEACRDFALTGGTANNMVAKIFGIVNAEDAQMLNVAIAEAQANTFGGALNHNSITWAQRQHDKYHGNPYRYAPGGRQHTPAFGKYNVQYMVEKIVNRAIDECGLTRAWTSIGTNYWLCMHWLTTDGVVEEHWWIEAYGYNIEIIPSWHDLKICAANEQDPDPNHYARVRIGLRSLVAAQIARIDNALTNGMLIPTNQGGRH